MGGKRILGSGDHGVATRVGAGSTKRSGLNAEAFHLKVKCLRPRAGAPVVVQLALPSNYSLVAEEADPTMMLPTVW
jgi:hypothetical protein